MGRVSVMLLGLAATVEIKAGCLSMGDALSQNFVNGVM